ncbi:MAG TPA: type II toxin-antitoxin system prevent-host-death family antitoxin [Vineibacter sp.]|nr:type II toxin-antitoxin system prevent-host-death family antitoxin [Vineibacter sp.]
MKFANMHQAKSRLSELVKAANKGEEVVICKAGTPVARIVPYGPQRKKRQFGLAKGKIWMAPDWDSPEVNDEVRRLFEEGDELS